MIEATSQPAIGAGTGFNDVEAGRVARAAAAPAQIGMAAVYAVIGYEWLVSGVNKLLLGQTFQRGLPEALRGGLAGNPNGWFVWIAERAVLPNAATFAVAVQIGELAIAAGYFVGAIAWVRSERLPRGCRSWVDPVVVGALLGSAVLAASYAMLAGELLPLPNPINAFGPGFSIDLLLSLAAWFLLPAQVATALARRRADARFETPALVDGANAVRVTSHG